MAYSVIMNSKNKTWRSGYKIYVSLTNLEGIQKLVPFPLHSIGFRSKSREIKENYEKTMKAIISDLKISDVRNHYKIARYVRIFLDEEADNKQKYNG